jgi:hypothetical protein
VLIMLQADRQMETFVFIIPRRMIVLKKIWDSFVPLKNNNADKI